MPLPGAIFLAITAVAAVGLFPGAASADQAKRPNLIWVMADDLGYGEVGCYGQQVIQTPRLDRMAAEGLRFTQFYAGATVCAPSRSVLMTGQHHGHTRVRGNAGRDNPAAQALQPGDVTVAAVLQKAGYRTALIGKWGLGDIGAAESGLPRKHGFDYFFGYLNQRHAHNHFPDFLWRNEERVELPNVVTPVGEDGAGYATEAKIYADDLFADEAIRFVSRKQGPALLPLLDHGHPARQQRADADPGRRRACARLRPVRGQGLACPGQGPGRDDHAAGRPRGPAARRACGSTASRKIRSSSSPATTARTTKASTTSAAFNPPAR